MNTVVYRKLAATWLSAASVAALSFGGWAWTTQSAVKPDQGPGISASESGAKVPGKSGSGNGSSDAKTFRIEGSVDGLYPGAERSIRLTITNPNSFAIRVTELAVAVTAGQGTSGCPAGSVAGSRWGGSVTVPKKGSIVVSGALSVRMAASAPPACENGRFPLEFDGKADKG